MASSYTITPSPQPTSFPFSKNFQPISLATMGISCSNFSGHPVASKRMPGFTGVTACWAQSRDFPLLQSLRKHVNGNEACNPAGDSKTSAFSSQGSVDHSSGIGISEFLRAKNFLIIGGTGFLAKVLIEKILRTNPDVGKIYVVINAKDTEAVTKRLQEEVVGIELFNSVQEIHGTDYHSFVEGTLIPVVGDIRKANLGIVPELASEIAEQVDIMANSAGNTNFQERYDVAMDINTLGRSGS